MTLERLIATKRRRVPSMYRMWDRRRTFLLIGAIYAATLVLALYHFAWRKVGRVTYNGTVNGTDNNSSSYSYSWQVVAETSEPITYWYVQSSHLLFGLLVVIGPLLVLFVLNCIIVTRLRTHNRHVSGTLFPGSDASASVIERIRRRERRVTLTVVLLVSVFIVFNLPSGIWGVLEFLATKYIKVIDVRRWYWDLGEASNALVCTGKAVNFWLYCSASSEYRRELRNVLTCRRCQNRRLRRDDTGRSRSTSRVSSSYSGLRYRRSMTANCQMSEIYSNGRGAAGMVSLL